ncbi:hypothetical protein IMSAGC004_02848 [Bacteroidaceae bacterium]|nr:hypothetical protein IMSAGC004_02848 [Bacteroidaceae bacterium]
MLKLLVYIVLVLYLMSCSSSRKERKLETCDIVAHSCINHDNSLLVADVGKAAYHYFFK